MKHQNALVLDRPTLFTTIAVAILYSFIALSCFSLLLQSARGGVITNSQGFYVITNPAPTVSLAWNKSPDASVVGYNLYYGVASGSYTNIINVGSATNTTVVLPARGVTFFFAVTAYTLAGLESAFSNEVNYAPPNPPPAPTMKPLVVLTVMRAQTPTGVFADSGFNWSESPDQPQSFYKLRIDKGFALAITPPPMPTK